MNSRKQAFPDHPVNPLITSRWSPYAFAERAVSGEDLRCLFEAARWTASSYNEQPWRYIVATKADPAAHSRMLSCLTEPNRVWAGAAPVLALGCTCLTFARNGQSNSAAEHDLGAASTSLTMEATARGLFVHQMIGILPDQVRELYSVPDSVRPLTGLAIGYAAEPNNLPEALRDRDLATRTRRHLAKFVFGGWWGTATDLAGMSESTKLG